jgi:hypothetical protein
MDTSLPSFEVWAAAASFVERVDKGEITPGCLDNWHKICQERTEVYLQGAAYRQVDLTGWEVTGPHFKDENHYLSCDGSNPDVLWPGYGWPLGTTAYYYHVKGHGWNLVPTGSTVEKAWARAAQLIESGAERTRYAMRV